MGTRRALARRLGIVETFQDPTPELEQYATSPTVAASLVHVADQRGDLADATLVDLGTGTGMLALAAALRGARRVVGVDVDATALCIARENAARVAAPGDVSWIVADATDLPLCFSERVTVLSNPPFGAQDGNRHADRSFLDQIQSIADVSYTVHNAGSREFVESFVADAGGTVTDAFAVELDVPKQFDFHTEATTTIDAEAYRIDWHGSAE
jgi:putative methylase